MLTSGRGGTLIFFSNRMGCVTSILVSVIGTLVLTFLFSGWGG